MSTILKALRRLEADERKKSEAQQFSADEKVSASSRRIFLSPLGWLLGGLAVFIGAGIGVGVRGWWAEGGTAPVSQLADRRVVLPPVEKGPEPLPTALAIEPGRAKAMREDSKSIPHVVSRPSAFRAARQTPVSNASEQGATVVAVAPGVAEASLRGVSERRAAEWPPAPAAVKRSVTPVASGPSRSVAALPVAVSTPAPAPPQEVVSLMAEGPATAKSQPGVEAAPQPQPEVKLAAVRPPPAVPSEADRGGVIPTGAAQAASKPVVGPQPEVTPPPVSAPAAAELEVMVLSTTWHPKSEKRSTSLSRTGRPSGRSFAEGDVWMGWNLVEIKLSGVSFERDGVRIDRRVGNVR